MRKNTPPPTPPHPLCQFLRHGALLRSEVEGDDAAPSLGSHYPCHRSGTDHTAGNKTLLSNTYSSTVRHRWVCTLEVIRGCVQFASASARTQGLHASTDPFPSQVCVEYPCREALTQPNAPESPEIYNHHLHLPDITGTVSVTVSDRNLQGELSSHPPPPPTDSGELVHVRAHRREMHLSISSR